MDNGGDKHDSQSTKQQPQPQHRFPIMQALATSMFHMNAQGKIQFPESVTSIAIDVGARGSDYLLTLQRTQDPTIALFLFDPLPGSIHPIQRAVYEYGLTSESPDSGPIGDILKLVDPVKANQLFAIRGALGDKESVMDFSIALGPACGIILKVSENNTFWCVESKSKIKTNVVTLEGLFELFPGNIDIHLKVDAEGADLLVLKGAGKSIKRLSTAIIECFPNKEADFFEGGCLWPEAEKFMQTNGFLTASEGQGNQVNGFFVNKALNVTIPPFLLEGSIHFSDNFYRPVSEKKWQGQ